jgi:hypothetical protein
MNVNYAASVTNVAYLNQRFGLELAHLFLGMDNAIIEGIVGRYSRGKRKGQLRGAIRWTKVVRGGWQRTQYGGRVAYPGEISNVEIVDAFTQRTI